MKKLLLTIVTAAALLLPVMPGLAQTRDFHGQYPNRSQDQMRSETRRHYRHNYRHRAYYPRQYGYYPYYGNYGGFYGPYYPPYALYNYPYGGYSFTPYGGVVRVPPGTSFYGWY